MHFYTSAIRTQNEVIFIQVRNITLRILSIENLGVEKRFGSCPRKFYTFDYINYFEADHNKRYSDRAF